MSVVWKSGFARTSPPSRHCYGGFGGGLQREKTPTDFLFRTDIILSSPVTGFGYRVEDQNNGLIDQGGFLASPSVLPGENSFSENDVIKLHWLKYGYQYQSVQVGMTRVTTSAFMFQLPNSNTVEANEAIVAARSYVFDRANKKVTFNQAVSQTQAYEVIQYEQSLAANADLLPAGEIFSTVLGNLYTLKSDWTLRFTAAPTGAWNVSGGKIEFSFSGGSFTDFDYDATLYFDTGADGAAFTFTNSTIPIVDVVAGYAGVGGIEVTPAGTTQAPTNNSPANITINAPQPAVTITGHPVGASIVIHDDDNADPQNKGTVLQRFDNAAASVQYTGTAGNQVIISMYEPGYKIFERSYTIPATDALFEITAEQETN